MRNRILMGLAVVAMVVLVGVLFGLWLSWNAPVQRAAEVPVPVAQGRPGEAPVAAVDEQSYLPEPPQPRMDGTRGVPARPVMPAEPVPLVSAAENPQPDTLISTIAPDLETLASPTQPAAGAQAEMPRVIVQQSFPEVATVVAGVEAPDPRGQAGEESWVQALRAELSRCASQGMVSRVLCNEQARWKYCNPDNRWGSVPEWPATGNN